MSLLFNRSYYLLIGNSNALGVLVTTDVNSEIVKGKGRSALQIEFSIEKSDNPKKNNRARITVYNLNDESIGKIKKDFKVILEAGYGDDDTGRNLLFSGQVKNVSTEVSQGTIKTVVTCEDGYVPSREGYTSTTFRGKTSVRDILRELITKDLGLPNPNMNNGKLGANTGLNKVYTKGSAKIGTTSEIITKICEDNFLTWSIRDGEALVYPVNGSSGVEVPLISVDSGMIDSPQKSQINVTKLDKSKDLKDVYKVKTLLQGAYNIGDMVKLESKFVNGVFKITALKHVGNYEGQDWITELVLSEGAD